MRRFGECIDDFHLGLGFCVCRVDNAERFTTRDEVQGGADIIHLRQLRFDFLPDAELLQRLLGVDAAWAGFDDADCNLAIARRADEVEAGLDLEGDAGVRGSMRTSALPRRSRRSRAESASCCRDNLEVSVRSPRFAIDVFRDSGPH